MDGRQVARIFQEPTGLYHVSDESLDYLDACGPGHVTKAAALRAAWTSGKSRVDIGRKNRHTARVKPVIHRR